MLEHKGQTAAVHGVVEDEVHCSIQTSQPLIGTVNNNITDAIVDNDTKVLTTYSMSRRNLETIVEAIKHLEGEKEPTFTPKVIQPEHQRQQLQKTTTQQQQQKQITQQQQHLSIIPQILIQHQQLVPQHLPFLKSPQKHQVKKTISHEHQVLKLLQQQQQQLLHKSTSLLQVAKNVHHHQQQQQQAHLHQQLQTSQFISLIQPSSPYCSPLSSPPLSSTPPQIMPHPLTSPTTHHFLSPIIICSPDSTFLKGATQLASLTTLDQS
ncbi:hypothetical protein HELRODRAFT_176726 [Helobdella robusta]|uniref:Uncharacterized protein n=1 Tax=Helobdella robusta TaxID=6412 RepID=T1FAU3_HELRO|nr:hypothetical protein HELRODRAFT_176726 [Helobdella robusta]ESN99559.1 hypothetical protein HELRODRAFT_176726 [Helobdella robusta]